MTGDPPRAHGHAATLRSIRLFDTLPEATLAAIAARGRSQQLQQGQILFFAGDPADAVHVLLDGRVKVIRQTEDGQESILRLIEPGEIFGGAGGWGSDSYPATAVALDDVTTFRVLATDFAALISAHADFALAVIRELGARLREAEARIVELQTERVERRIARTLLRLAGKTGRQTTAGIELGLPQSRQHLAELTGATLSTVSRVLQAWDRQGLVTAGRERVTIVKPHELVMIAEDIDAASIP